jgi:hypothetical protein
MGVYATVSGRELSFRAFTFDDNTCCFVSEPEADTGLTLSVAAPINVDRQFDSKEFFVHLFSKAELVESEIFQVVDHLRSKRIGWCIPVNALTSTDHDEAENVHFRRYAYAALKTCLNSFPAEIFTKHPQLEDSIKISISDILPDSTSVFIVSKETLEGDFDIAQWIPAFAALGYFQLTSIDPINIYVRHAKISDKQVRITPASREIADLSHIHGIYTRAYPFEAKPHFQFFYLYQIVEALLELVFRKEQANLVQKLIASKDDLNGTKDLLDGASTNISEKRRMGLLARTYCQCEGDISEFVSVCNELLRLLGKKEGSNMETTLYPIRNFLFHQYRNFPSNGESVLGRVIESLASLLPVLLSNFRPPVELQDSLEAQAA